MKTRLKLSKEASDMLLKMKIQSNLTPNYLCRYAFSIYIEERNNFPLLPLNFDYDNNGLEFLRHTLTGEYDLLYKSLIIYQNKKAINDDEYFTKYLKAYIEQGIRKLDQEIQMNKSFENFTLKFYDPNQGGTV